MNRNITYEDERHMPMTSYKQPPVFYDDSKRYVTNYQLDEADALLLGLEKSMADKNWALDGDDPSLFLNDCIVGQAAGIWDPYQLAHPSINDSWCADSKTLAKYDGNCPTQPGRICPTLFHEPKLPQANNCMKRAFQQSPCTHSQVTAPPAKRSRRSDASEVQRENIETTKIGQYQETLDFKTKQGHTFRPNTTQGRILSKVNATPSMRSQRCNPVEVANEKSEATKVEESLPKFRDYQEQQWQCKFQGLLEFKTKHGHCCVPNTYEPNIILGRWVKRQRHQYKLRQAGQQSTLVVSRVRILEDVGFVWDSHSALWEERLNELKDYHQANGHCSVPSTYPKNKPLSTWVKCQRRQFRLTGKGKNSNLTEERIAALDDLGFVWDGRTIGSNARKHDVVEKTRPRSTRVSKFSHASVPYDFERNVQHPHKLDNGGLRIYSPRPSEPISDSGMLGLRLHNRPSLANSMNGQMRSGRGVFL